MDTFVISFPYYATPVGSVVRKILTEGFPKSVRVKPEREIDLKMLLFAINRLEILNCILSCKKCDIYTLDRGPFSNALTIGYHLFTNPQESNQREKLVLKALGFDSFFREILNVDECVICLKHQDTAWVKSRNEDRGDLYEREEIQEISNGIYDIFEKEICEGWRNVVTKDRDGWRKREDIKRECLEFVSERGLIKPNSKEEVGELLYLGIQEVIDFLYNDSEVESDLQEAWLRSLRENDKKEMYRVSELVSTALVSTTERLQWSNMELKRYLSSLLESYPEIFAILEKALGKSFRNIFEKSLN